jgi:hypothetical protein
MVAQRLQQLLQLACITGFSGNTKNFIQLATAGTVEPIDSRPPKGSRRTRAPAGPPNMTLVDNYLRRLEAALGKDDKFMPLYQELKSDSEMTRPEMVQLAN